MAKQAKTGTDRKKAQRERDRTQGVRRIEIRLSAEAIAALDRACGIRGGVRGAYDLSEYVETLVRQDRQRLDLHLEQLKEAGPCKACGRELPEGCGGEWQEESSCFHRMEYRQLLLSEPKRLPPLTESEFNALFADN